MRHVTESKWNIKPFFQAKIQTKKFPIDLPHRSADHHDAHMTTTAGDKEEESGGGKNKLESLAENFFRKRQQLSQPDDDRGAIQ